MMPELNTYIDRCIIDEYAMRTDDGFQLDVDDLPQHEKLNFLTRMLENDTSLRDIGLNLMQFLVDERLREYEVEYLRARGMQRVHLSNGDTRLERQPYASHF